MLIEVTGLKSSITELNHFNTIGEKNWKNEFFNKKKPVIFVLSLNQNQKLHNYYLLNGKHR